MLPSAPSGSSSFLCPGQERVYNSCRRHRKPLQRTCNCAAAASCTADCYTRTPIHSGHTPASLPEGDRNEAAPMSAQARKPWQQCPPRGPNKRCKLGSHGVQACSKKQLNPKTCKVTTCRRTAMDLRHNHLQRVNMLRCAKL